MSYKTIICRIKRPVPVVNWGEAMSVLIITIIHHYSSVFQGRLPHSCGIAQLFFKYLSLPLYLPSCLQLAPENKAWKPHSFAGRRGDPKYPNTLTECSLLFLQNLDKEAGENNKMWTTLTKQILFLVYLRNSPALKKEHRRAAFKGFIWLI